MIKKRSTCALVERYADLERRLSNRIGPREKGHIIDQIERIEQEMVRRYGTDRGLTERYVLWCSDLEEQGITTEPCCGSCHSDWEYDPLPMENRLTDGRYFVACCAKSNDLETRKLVKENA